MISNETGASKQQTAEPKLHTQNKGNLVCMLFQRAEKALNRGSSIKHQHLFNLTHSNRKKSMPVFHFSVLQHTILGHIYGDILLLFYCLLLNHFC